MSELEKEQLAGSAGEKNEKNPNSTITNTPSDTYYEYRDENGGCFELDLVLVRERGKVTKYLSVAFSGNDLRNDPPTPQSAFAAIGTKEEFEKFKNFIAQLNWE